MSAVASTTASPNDARTRSPEIEATKDRSKSPLGKSVGPVVAAVALLAIYILMSLFTDPAGHLITDVGGKAATLEAMAIGGDWDVDLGYWFEAQDPDGTHYPYAYTAHTANDKWINTTALTMVYAMRPLYDLGGARLALLIPMLGAVATALAAAALERRLDPSNDGAWSFWIVGLATPVFVYSLDLWEHTLGLAGMAIGVVCVHDTVFGSHPARSAFLAGLGYGFAATMRQEALVFGFVAGLVILVAVAARRGLSKGVAVGSSMAVATAAVLAVHTVAEFAALGGALRFARSTGTVSGASTDVGDRLDAAGLTVLAIFNGSSPITHLFGLVLVASLIWLTIDVLSGRTPHRSKLLTIGMAILAVVVLAVELRPVPGMFAATPLAAVGLAAAARGRSWFVLSMGLAPLPLVLVAQFADGAAFQWGGRYLLLTGFVLAVNAVAALRNDHRKFLGIVAIGGLCMTLYGVTWATYRMDRATDDRDVIIAMTSPEEVVVWRNDATAREMGPTMLDRRWLSAEDAAEQSALPALLIGAGIESFVWIDESSSSIESFEGFQPAGQIGVLTLFDQRLTRYIATPS